MTGQQIATMHEALHDFGYTDLRHDDVRESAERVERGEEPQGIIDMFVRKFMRDAGLVS